MQLPIFRRCLLPLFYHVVDVEELQQHLTQSSRQREEVIRLKQELQLLHRDLLLSGTRTANATKQSFIGHCFLTNCWLEIQFCLLSPGEGDTWKDELLELARSKQERTMSELRCLQQVQRLDLQPLPTANCCCNAARN